MTVGRFVVQEARHMTAWPGLYRRFSAVLILTLAWAGPAAATVKYVTPTGSVANAGDSWGNAYSNIQDAIDVCTTEGDFIYLCDGTWSNTAALVINAAPGVTIEGGYAGNGTPGLLTNEPSVLTRASGLNIRIIDADSSTVTLHRVTIRDGHITSATSPGGALQLTGGRTVITNCTVEASEIDSVDNNANAETRGGAIYASGGSLDIVGSKICNNYAYHHHGSYCKIQRGGGLYAAGVTVTIRDSAFSNNYARCNTAYGAWV